MFLEIDYVTVLHFCLCRQIDITLFFFLFLNIYE